MGRLLACLLISSAALFAQTAETAYFRAVMLPTNEVPPTSTTATGVADIIAHVVRDSTGQITSGTVDFLVRVNFPADAVATGLHIHNGTAGNNAGVVIGTSLSANNNRPIKAGGDTISLPVQIAETPSNALTALRGMFDNPAGYYVNIHTTDFGGGAIRGQLERATGTVLMGLMRGENEVPPVAGASGTSVVVAIGTFDSNGNLTSGETYQSTSYRIDDRGTFTGFHIHNGTAGNNGTVVINTGIPAGTAISDTGVGQVGPYYSEINPTNATQVAAFKDLFNKPGDHYINIHTNQHGGGVMRAQLRPTDAMSFQVLMSSQNETSATTIAATAPAVFTLRTLRNEDGSIAAAMGIFDVNYRLPGPANFTGLHVHDGAAGQSGPVSLGMIPQYDVAFSSTTAAGNYFNWTQGLPTVATAEDISKNPENHYINIHTSTDGAGVARAQLARVISTPGTVRGALAGNLATNNVAPGGLITIFGTDLAKVATGLSGWQGNTLPTSLNAASVTIGGKAAPLLYVSNTQINAQVPYEVPAGTQSIVVTNGVGPSASFNVTVAQAAPAIFVYPVPAIVQSTNFSLISASNPAAVGDTIIVYATGLGTTTPGLGTGALSSGGTTAATQPVTASIGGKPATVVYSVAAPGYAGVYQVAITVPSGVSGNAAVVITENGVNSNSATIAVK